MDEAEEREEQVNRKKEKLIDGRQKIEKATRNGKKSRNEDEGERGRSKDV